MARKELISDLTTGSVPRTLIRFSLPLFLSGLLQMVYNMVDMVVVGRFVGTQGLSAVSIGGEVMQLITFVAMGLSNAGQILLSRYVGEQRRDRIGEMVATLFTLLMGLAVFITVVFLFGYRGVPASGALCSSTAITWCPPYCAAWAIPGIPSCSLPWPR